MSKYTTEVRYICESYAGLTESKGYDEINDIISESEDKIFEEYPIFDEDYRSVLNTKILRHYYTREICAETVGLWKLWLNNTMNEIMPYYNQLYESALLKFNPMYDVDLSTTRLGSENGSNESANQNNKLSNNQSNKKITESVSESGSSNKNNVKSNVLSDIEDNETTVTHNTNDAKTFVENGKEVGDNNINENGVINKNGTNNTDSVNKNRYSDTPQGGLNGMESVENNLYLTNATINDGNVDVVTKDNEINNKSRAEALNKTFNKNNNENIAHTGSTTTTDDIGKTLESNEIESGNESRSNSQSRTHSDDSNDVLSENNNGSTTGSYHNLNEYTEHVAGKRGGVSYSAMLNEFRSTFLNIDLMIIKALEDLFFKLY